MTDSSVPKVIAVSAASDVTVRVLGIPGPRGTGGSADVLGTVIAGFTSGAGAVADTDTLLEALGKLDGNIAGNTSALAGKSNTGHSHAIGDVTGLQTALDGKAEDSHSHPIGDVTGLQTALDMKVDSDPTGITGADQITNMVSLTTAEYGAITPDASTLYVITDA